MKNDPEIYNRMEVHAEQPQAGQSVNFLSEILHYENVYIKKLH